MFSMWSWIQIINNMNNNYLHTDASTHYFGSWGQLLEYIKTCPKLDRSFLVKAIENTIKKDTK